TVTAQNTSDMTVGTVSAAGGLGAGIGTTAEAFVTPKVFASIENGAIIDTTGDVKVDATSLRAKAAATARGFAIGGVEVGVVISEGHVTPTVQGYVGKGATVTAGGRVDVLADILAQSTGTPKDDFFQPPTDVDTSKDTIHFD